MGPDKKRHFGFLKIVGIVVVLLVVVVLAIPFFIDANQFRPKLESELRGALGRQVKVGNLKLSLLSGSVAADDIAIADDPRFSSSPFVLARSLQVGVEIKPLIVSRALRITGITLDKPEITLIRSASGAWNVSGIGSGKPAVRPSGEPGTASAAQVSVGRLKVTGGRITVVRGGERGKRSLYDNVTITASDVSLESEFPFALAATLPGGGSLKLEGKAGPVNSTDAALTPFTATVALSHFDLIASGFLEPDSGLAGIIDFKGGVTSDGRQVKSDGRATAGSLQFVKGGSPAGKQVSLEYAVIHNLQSDSGTLTDAKVGIGKAVAHLNGNYDLRGDLPTLKMRLLGENMPAPELEAMLPAAGVTLPKGSAIDGGTINVDLTTTGPIGKGVTTGTVNLANARLTGFDLGSKMAKVASLTGIKAGSVTDIERFTSELRMTPEGIQVNSVSLIVPNLGQLNGNGTVGADASLNFKMLGRLVTSGGITGELARLTGSKEGVLSVPFFIRGTTSDPSFVPDTKGLAGSILGSGAKPGEGTGVQSLADSLRNLLGKKKK